VTCYHRHLRGLFGQLDIPYDADGRRRVHAAILEVLGLPGSAPCPQVWADLKAAYGPVAEHVPELARDVRAALPQ
jgi:hypothetical protein